MKNHYDVVIAGAGPAGLECARQLGGTALSVLLLERNKVIGPKTCAGGLTRLPPGFDLPETMARTFTRQTVMLDSGDIHVNLVRPLRTVDRADLGRLQLEKIASCDNITILTDAALVSMQDSCVHTSRGSFSFSFLVGADGSSSIVRRHIGLETRMCAGICCNVPDITHEFIWYFSNKSMRSGYIWVFPHLGCTNVGVYFDPRRIPAGHARAALKDFMKLRGYPVTGAALKGGCTSYLYRGCVFGNVFLAGDAAGLASRATGEGISAAIVSGNEVAKKILDPAYTMPELARVLRLKQKQERIQSLLRTFPFARKNLLRVLAALTTRAWFQSYFGN